MRESTRRKGGNILRQRGFFSKAEIVDLSNDKIAELLRVGFCE